MIMDNSKKNILTKTTVIYAKTIQKLYASTDFGTNATS